ncbi:medium-chain acyl-CoA ligase ACSF2, mitochondrial-like [Ixodes scapularis]|uniref:medium-chain acyl-CoA ligase ACSF2, mitochondrial-like n=1 Tax=Ixodes scapularis TaxID=6945 RepID=UPI001C3808FB|nr:medium-chain acyl-CoA ligase ACSF2, mitochondrial-like [Ixodes scapularis]
MLLIRARTVVNPLRRIARISSETNHFKRDLSKLSYFHNPGKEPLLTWTAGDVIDRAADVFGDTTGIVYPHQNISKTYTEYKKDVDQLAASLVSLKLPVGSRVAILAPRLYEGAQLLYAASKAGLVMVGIHTFCTLSELEFCLNKTECAALFFGEKFLNNKYYEMLLQIAPELEKSSPRELNIQRLPFLKHVFTIGNDRMPGTITFNDLMNSATAEDHAIMNSFSAKVQFDQDAFIQFSSGTTGQPKPARLSHFNVVNNANTLGRFIGYHQKREIMCLNADLIYGFGRTLGVLAATMFGSTAVIPGARFSPKATLETITNYRCTIATGSTSIFSDIMRKLEEGSYDVSSVRKAIMSGSLCNPAIVEKVRTRLNAQAVYIMYGATETSPIFSSTNPDEPTDRWIRTIGTPLDHVEVKVVDAEGRIVPLNTRGELCTRGPHVFKGYLNDEDKTNEAIRDNWYHTGDEGTMDEDGRLTFVGRIKEMINFMGLKVPPLEIENILNSHPAVEEAQVFGVPDEEVVEKICVWIKAKPDRTLTSEDIKSFCKDKKLPWYKVPEYVLFVDSFPRTQTGKVQKHKMREESKRLLNL